MTIKIPKLEFVYCIEYNWGPSFNHHWIFLRDVL